MFFNSFFRKKISSLFFSYSTPHDPLAFIKISPEQKAAVKAWWKAFTKDQHRIDALLTGKDDNTIDLVSWMNGHLHHIDQNIMWEFGPGRKKAHRLIITSETDRSLRPLVQYILSQAPTYKLWEFYAYRPSEDLKKANELIASRTCWTDVSDITFELSPGSHYMIRITFYIPPSLKQAPEIQACNAYILAEILLGEEILDKWIGHIDVQVEAQEELFQIKDSQSLQQLLPLIHLKESVSKAIKTRKSQLPQQPYFQLIENEEMDWSLYTSKPNEKTDYAGKQDLYISSFVVTEEDLFNATYRGYEAFSSERFSNFNETFIYLKIDGTAGDLNEEILIDRATTEDMLNEVLLKEKIGCVIGGGTGLRYSYIDFAVVDLTKAIEAIKSALQKNNFTKRSWLLFHDAIYQSQWIGIWQNSPAPLIEIS